MNRKANKLAVIELPAASPLGYTVEEAARILGISRNSVMRLAAGGGLDMRKQIGTRYRITEKSLRKFMQEATQ